MTMSLLGQLLHQFLLDHTTSHPPTMNNENYDPSFPDQPVVDLYLPVWANLPAFSSKPAFIWADSGLADPIRGTTLTYSELDGSVCSISSRLLIHPLYRGDTVLVLCPPGLELIEIIFGCQRAGLVSIPIFPPDPDFAQENQHHHHLIRILSQTKPMAAIAPSAYIQRVSHYVSSSSTEQNKSFAKMLQNLRWVSTEELTSISNDKAEGVQIGSLGSPFTTSYNGCKPDEVYLIQYTSGATGIPKPVLVTAGSAAHNVRSARKAYDLHPNSIITSWLPQYHDCGLMFLLLTVVSGATCVLTSPASFVQRPRLWLELITEFKATCTPVPSFTLPLVVKRGGVAGGASPVNLATLKNLILINEPIYRAPVEEFVHVFSPFGLNPSCISPSYGLAENGTFVSTAWRSYYSSGGSTAFPSLPTHNKLLPVARLALMYNDSNIDEEEDMHIVVANEETGEPVEDGIEGEIWVASPSNASGYLGHPSLTREVFHARLSNMVSRRFLRTGDRGVVKGQERFLFVTGRCADVIKLRNNEATASVPIYIHPHYLETTAYESFPQFLRGGCLAAFEVKPRMIAIVAEMQRKEVDDAVLRRVCKGIKDVVLKEEKVEVGVVVLVRSGSVPKTTSGKIQRWLAKHMLSRGKMSVAMEMEFGVCNSTNDSGDELPCSTRSSAVNEGRSGIAEAGYSLASTVSSTRPKLLSLL